ncbi:MAG: hypothetical protein WC374_06425 [Phycisphaerae bacterium]|jgi:hypothetical protein
MSIATHAIKYGWVYLASLTLGTGTIFMVNPVLNRITLHDRIEVIMGTVERCYATQTGTNADGTPIYAVAPPVEVRTWTDTNGVSVTVTNAIEWRDDLSMKVSIDAKIFALIPCYVDPDTVYDGTTNITMLTVTGLFASLQIGDHTNQFTAIPAIGTNAVTFGPWAWRNYRVAWQERYKMLNALKMTKTPINYQGGGPGGNDEAYKIIYYGSSYSNLISQWNTLDWSWQSAGSYLLSECIGVKWSSSEWEFVRYGMYLTNVSFIANTNLSATNAQIYAITEAYPLSGTNTAVYFDMDYNTVAPGTPVFITNFNLPDKYIGEINIGYTNSIYLETDFIGVLKGYQMHKPSVYVLWQFTYATNKFW